MKIKKKTPHFSLDHNLCFSLPTSWSEITQDQFYIISSILSKYTGYEAKLRLLMRFLNIRVLGNIDNITHCTTKVNHKTIRFTLKDFELSYYLKIIDFIFTPCSPVIRLDVIKGFHAVDPELHNVSFSDWLVCENYFQGFIITNDYECLSNIFHILYKKKKLDPRNRLSLSATYLTSILIWYTGIKQRLSIMFPNFFRPVSTKIDPPNMIDIMNNEIRALTGGDVTKEKTILDLDVWRALTELDAKAKEFEDYKNKTKSK